MNKIQASEKVTDALIALLNETIRSSVTMLTIDDRKAVAMVLYDYADQLVAKSDRRDGM